MNERMTLESLTEAIIGAAIDVHRELGPGFLESIYENALAIELRARQIPFQRQLTVPVLYRGVEVGLHRLDLFVFDQIWWSSRPSPRSKTSTSSSPGLKAVGRDHGLLLNFAQPTLEIKRVSTKRFSS